MSLSTVLRRVMRGMEVRCHLQASLLCAVMSILWLTTSTSLLQGGETEIERVAFNREEKTDALRAIPFRQLDDATQAKVSGVVQNPSLFRRLPVQVIDCDQEMYQFLVGNPEVVVGIWQLMGITTVNVNRLNDHQLHADDGAGTVTDIHVAYADDNTRLLIADGYYEGPMAPGRINAQCVLLLKSGFTRTDHGRDFVSNRLDVFVKFENKGADILAKTLHPFIGKTADHNFTESTAFLAKISKNSEENLPAMHQLAQRLSTINPEVRQEFSQVVSRVHSRSVASRRKLLGQSASSELADAEAKTPKGEPGKFTAGEEGETIRALNVPPRATTTDLTKYRSPQGQTIADSSPVPRKKSAILRR
ncbi:MAG: hypothetical protein WDZ51_08890 [Pirellulaceae bacterium]